jgi:SAM-dependent methyltransferase
LSKSANKDSSVQSDKSKKVGKIKSELTLDDIIDLTVVELYILNFLVRIGGSAIRFAVFNELNAKLETNKISRSSFYHSLTKLKDRGFVEIESNPKGKGSLVKATPMARSAVKRSNIFSIWSNIDLSKIALNISKQLIVDVDKSGSQIYLSFDEIPNLNTISVITTLGSTTNILVDKEMEETYTSRLLEIPFSKFENEVIKEPNDYFDRGIISNYFPSSLMYGVQANYLLKEIVRVIKPDGEIIVICFNELPATNNIILDSIMSDLFNEIIFHPANPEFVKSELIDIGIEIVNELNFKGYFVIVGKK